MNACRLRRRTRRHGTAAGRRHRRRRADRLLHPPSHRGGEAFGADQPVVLQLLEIPAEGPQKAMRGVAMELDDCAFPLLEGWC